MHGKPKRKKKSSQNVHRGKGGLCVEAPADGYATSFAILSWMAGAGLQDHILGDVDKMQAN